MAYRILVCGGREYDDWAYFTKVMWDVLDNLLDEVKDDVMFIQGGAKGADFLCKIFAKSERFDCEEYPANWKKHGRVAGIIRNKKMLEEGKPDLVVAFQGGRGTAHMVKLAKEAKVEVLNYDR